MQSSYEISANSLHVSNLKDRLSCSVIRQLEAELPVESAHNSIKICGRRFCSLPPRPTECGINLIDSIRRSNYNHLRDFESNV